MSLSSPQGVWLRSEVNPRVVTTEQDLSPETVNILERQANLFAAPAAAPAWLVCAIIVKLFRPVRPFVYFGPSTYWIETNGRSRSFYVSDFDGLCQTIAGQMQPYFGRFSKEALAYRVRESGWVIDKTKPMVKLFRKARRPSELVPLA
jgi:hypothetical protein